ncbi:thymine DNA glycosylase isoform 3-T9 [Cochliomyia hominivorax]
MQTNNSINRNISRSLQFRSNGNEQQQQFEYENDLSHLSNSICSENSTEASEDQSSNISMENFNEKFPANEPKQHLEEVVSTEQIEQNQKNLFKSTNETMNSSLLNSTKHPQNTMDIGISNSPRDEQYHHYNAEDKNGCAIKTSPSTLPPINIKPQNELETSNFQNASFQEAIVEGEGRLEIKSVVAAASDTKNSKDDKEELYYNPKTSINAIDENDDKNINLKIDDPITIGQSRQNSLEKDEAENLHTNLENQQQTGKEDESEEKHFDKYLEKNFQAQHSEFETQPNSERITHQQQQQHQHEKDILEAADKVYTQIEEQYHQQHISSMSSTYEHMINNHQQHQSNPQEPEEHQLQRHDVAMHPHQQLQDALQHPMQQQQHHYSTEQLYQVQQQQDHHHMQQHQMQKQQDELQQQHHNTIRNPQREHRQQHSHLMDFLHPQHHHPNATNTHSPLHQQQQIHEVYHELMMDEFHEEHNTPYKLGLSPSTVKHENQDDGYETSAGDVLTPNSHASSTHSVTPQHHMQHGGIVTNVVKCEDQPQHQNVRLQQQSQHTSHVINDGNQNIPPELVPNESAANVTPRDPYHFIDDDLNSATNNSLRNILTPPHSHTRNNQDGTPINGFIPMSSDVSATTDLNSANDIYGINNSTVHHHPQKQSCLDNHSNTPGTKGDKQQHYNEGSTSDVAAQEQDSILNLQTKSIQKRRGRKKKIPEGGLPPTIEMSNPNNVNAIAGFTKTKERKKHDRFNGMSEEEVVKRILPDHLCDNLDIVIIGINPGLFAAYKGHHYAGPGNHFWKCLYLSGLTQEQMNADEDFKLMKYGIGFTNMVQRATKGSADLTRKEIKEGSRILLEKLQRFRPKIAVFNGKLIFEVFSGKKDFNFGRQPECVEGTDTFIWVMPSSSARCAQLPRAADKVPFYTALKKFRDYLNGLIPHIDQSECVFTEERIKQQCEQENYKNQQKNTDGGANETTYQNAVDISNSNNSIQNSGGYAFDTETNPHGACEGPGPPPTTGDGNVNNSFMMSSLVGSHHEKKKRGRPKKNKGQEMIDPVTGNKIQVPCGQMMGANNGDYSNILNLSVVPVTSSEMPKKKRGRPKKVKPTHPNMLQHDIAQTTSMLSQKPNIMSIQSLTTDITQGLPHHLQEIQTSHQHVAMYSTPPPHQRSIYSPMPSPMASPSLNCSYTTNTPPSQPHHDKLGLPTNGRESTKPSSTDIVPSTHHQHSIQEQNFGASPPPSSPNICAVDFEPPTASTASSSIVSENVNSDLNTMHQRLHGSHQRSRFNSPISGEATPDHNANEHFQQWLSPQPNHNIHSPATSTIFSNSPQQSSLNYHDQQQQMQAIQQQQQDVHSQWPLRHQSRYDELSNSPYLQSSQLHQTHTHTNHNNQSQQSSGSDVARKSLSGLESLVDQIPTISESESIALSSAAAVNAQVAAAAAVESRLQGMQNTSLNESSQVEDESHFSSITGTQSVLTASNSPSAASSNNNQFQQSSTASNILNSNFSVSNLAASSATTSSSNHENYGLSANTRPLGNHNAYHHSNLMAAAVLAAAAANTPTNLSTPSGVTGTTNHHASMYMDPHAHLTTHVPVNPIYPTAAPPTHHHHSAVAAHHHHHAAAAHYGSAHHAAADYATPNNPYTPAQSNVAAGHTLHMPSPNYPYGYSTSSQTNYSTYPHSHHVNHHHGHPHAHHLAMFDRLKPSDITGYSSGF